MRLRRREKQYARSLARQCYMESGGNEQEFSFLFRARAESVSIDPALLALLLQFAMVLLKWWLEKNISEPSVVASMDEPGFYDEDANDAD